MMSMQAPLCSQATDFLPGTEARSWKENLSWPPNAYQVDLGCWQRAALSTPHTERLGANVG